MKRTLTIAAALLALIAGVGCQKTEPTTPVDPTPTDRYADAVETTLAKIDALSEGTQVCVKNVNVIAATTSFKIIHDGTDIGATTADLQIGQKATIKGVRSGFSQYLDYVAITDCDVYDVTESDYKAPEAIDITEEIDTYTNDSPTLVTVSGNVTAVEKDGDKIITVSVGEKATPVCFIHPLESLGFAALKGHDVTVTAYVYNCGDKIGLIGVATKVEDEGLPPVTERLAEWVFSAENMSTYGPTFTGAELSGGAYTAEEDKTAGDGGKYVAATTGNAKISYVNVDKSSIEQKSKTYVQRIVGKTGEPYVTGVWTGDYWLFNVTLSKAYAAGSTVDFGAVMRSSNGSMKYWMLEIKDGEDWKPMLETKNVKKDGVTVTYNCEQVGADYLNVVASYKLTAEAANTLQIRYRCMGTYKASDGSLKTELDGGTHRIAGGEKYIKPYIDITYEQK